MVSWRSRPRFRPCGGRRARATLEGVVGISAAAIAFLLPGITLFVLVFFVSSWALIFGRPRDRRRFPFGCRRWALVACRIDPTNFQTVGSARVRARARPAQIPKHRAHPLLISRPFVVSVNAKCVNATTAEWPVTTGSSVSANRGSAVRNSAPRLELLRPRGSLSVERRARASGANPERRS
jgi:hypothetical protein